jgi:hypothetical protein
VPCVEYWVNDERQNNPNHGLIYAAIVYRGRIDGSTDTKFDGADATLVEWYPFSQSSFDGFPPPRTSRGPGRGRGRGRGQDGVASLQRSMRPTQPGS